MRATVYVPLCRNTQLPDELLEDVAHLLVRHDIGVEVDFAKPRDHEEQAVALIELADFLLEAKIFDDVAGLGGEALDVTGQVCGNIVRVILEFLESQLARVVKRVASGTVQHGLDVLELLALERCEFLQDLD